MFGYINKNELLKTLKEEISIQDRLRKTYNDIASDNRERQLVAKTEGERKWFEAEIYKYRQWSDEANWKWCEAATIYNMIKQM